jgi:hypothetical protein
VYIFMGVGLLILSMNLVPFSLCRCPFNEMMCSD